MDNRLDTIAAIATALGESAIAVVRLSGAEAVPIAQRLLARPRAAGDARDAASGAPATSSTAIPGDVDDLEPRPVKEFRLKPRTAHLCVLLDSDGQPLDQAVATWYQAPRSYTGEDVIEISVHGGHTAARACLAACVRSGARLADPGEFTLRAFLNGRMDLAQAEGVIASIQAKTTEALRLANRQLTGALSARVMAVRSLALGLLAVVEAAVDFPEDVDEPDPVELIARLEQGTAECAALAAELNAGRLYQEGVRLVILGRPNVGKSSLLNALLREERAIVTAVPGTTRDSIEEQVAIGGVPVHLVDTAGLRETDDLVEQLGVERARRAVSAAAVCLLVLDRSAPLTPQDQQALNLTAGKPAIVAVNKADLPAQWRWGWTDGRLGLGDLSVPQAHWPVPPAVVETAAALGEGTTAVEQAFLETVFCGRPPEHIMGYSLRHMASLQRAGDSLRHTAEGARRGVPIDLLSVDLRGALQALGDITGETAHQDLLHEIFSRFCIGK